MEYSKVRYEKKNHTAYIYLDSQKNLNAFNGPMIEEVTQALHAASEDEQVRVIVLTALGRVFSAGGDIVEMEQGLQRDEIVFEKTVPDIARLSYLIKQIPKPVIASVFGSVAGAAFNIALACDLCIAAEGTKFMQAFVNLGLVPDAGGLFLLTRAVGANKAMELVMLGTAVTAEEGKQYGFVHQVCAKEALPEQTAKLAERLEKGPAAAYAQMKSLMLQAQFGGYEAYSVQESKAQVACGHTADFREGVYAFLEKRKPEFRGK